MGDNETGIVTNEENDDVQSKISPVISNTDIVDEEIKQSTNSSHKAGNLSKTFDSSELADTKSEVKGELDQKERSEIESKHEDIASEIQSTVSLPNSESNPKTGIITEDSVLESSETIVPIGSSPNKLDISHSMRNDRTTINTLSAGARIREKNLSRNQSDILPSLREIPKHEDASMMIFSNKGLPTKNYYKRRNLNSSIFGDERDVPPAQERGNKVELTPKISQTVPKMEAERKMQGNPLSDRHTNVSTNPNTSISRNVLTGRGVNSLDEFKSKSTRRKDGNPLLGIGYDEPVIPNNKGRVPPGGFSSGLW